jgi:iron complex outermembrane receptor protein
MKTDNSRQGKLPALRALLPPLLTVLSNAVAASGEEDITGLSMEALLDIEVSTASKFPQKTLEAPAATTIITAADIKDYGYRTLADILRSARGFYTSYDRNYEYVGVRGFGRPSDYNSRILLLVDGYRVNETIYDAASIGTEFLLDVDLIERVEIVRGPGSSVYGSNALFGVVNVITKSGRDYNGLEASGEYAGFDTNRERATFGKKHDNGAEWMLSGSHYDRRGSDLFYPEYASPETNNGVAEGLDGDRYNQAYGKLSYDGLTLAGAYSERIKDLSAASFGTLFNDPRSQTTDSQAMLDLKYYRVLEGNLDVSGHVYYGNYFYDGVYPYDRPPTTVNKDFSWSEWWGTEIRAVKRYDRHKLVLGGEYQDNFRQDFINYDDNPYSLYLDSRRSSYRYGFYAQDEIDLGYGVLFNAGLRYDYYSTSGDALNPRLALIWSPWESTALKLLYGTAFRAPNDFELVYGDGITSKPNPGLQPEEIATYEFIAEHYLQPNFRLTLDVYRNEISNLINLATDSADGLEMFTNLGQAETNGAELEAERLWDNGARLRASYAWQTTRDGESGEVLSNSPEHMAKLNLTAPLWSEKLRAGLELQYTSLRNTLSGGSTDGYWLANLTLLGEQLAPGVDVSATVYNLLDQHYSLPVGAEFASDAMVQDGVNFRVKLTVRY